MNSMLLHLSTSHQLASDDGGTELWIGIVANLHPEEVENAEDSEKGQKSTAIGALGEVSRHFLEDVQLAHPISNRHNNNQLYVNTYHIAIKPNQPLNMRRTGIKAGFNFIIMSFGQHQYQHRFHKEAKGKARLQTLPVTPYYPHAEYNDYLYNSLLIDSFKKDADYHRAHRRLRSLAPYYPHHYNYQYPYHYYDGLTLPRVFTEPPLVEPPPKMVYVNKESPDVLPTLINYSAMASRVRDAERDAEKAQFQAAHSKEQLREYRHKYERLKSRLRQEVGERRMKEAELRRVREVEMEQERHKLEKMRQAVMQMSHQVSNNSRIMQENLRMRQQLGQLTTDRAVVFPTVPTVLSRSVLIDRPTLDSQYRQMRRLKKQISDLDRKLGHSSSHN